MSVHYVPRNAGEVIEKLPPSLRAIYEAYGSDYDPLEDNPARALAEALERFDSLLGRKEEVTELWTRIDEYFETRPSISSPATVRKANGYSGAESEASAVWIGECRRTFEGNLPDLINRYPGKCVAISGGQILEAGDLPALFRKYSQADTPPVEFFFVPKSEPSVGSFQGPSGVLPEK